MHITNSHKRSICTNADDQDFEVIASKIPFECCYLH